MTFSRGLELGAATLLSLAALASSWSGYQATLWNGIQARSAAEANGRRACASRAFERAGQRRLVDLTAFVNWAAAYSANDTRLRLFHERRFRPTLRAAFDAWVAAAPGRNVNAPATPFDMPQYRVPDDELVKRCDRAAAVASADMQAANDASDRYMLATVIFATVMFFAGAVRDSHSRDVRLVMLTIAFVACCVGIMFIAQLPAAAG